MPYTFGFELELAHPVNNVLTELWRRDLLPDSGLHAYHCDCEECGDWNVPLRAQRDSTCGGELISGVFSDLDGAEFRELLEHLRSVLPRGTVDVNCGLHVHVKLNNRMPRRERCINTYALLEEHIVTILAPGRFRMKRAMNRTLTEGVMFYVQAQRWQDPPHDVTADPIGTIDMAIRTDRHIDLNFDDERTRTAEYRVFNSTLTGWRIELACRLSVWLAQQNFPERVWELGHALLDAVTARSPLMPSPYLWNEFVAMVNNTDSRCAELMAKQADYVRIRNLTN